MHSFYLRNMYLHNLLAQPGGITRRRADRPAQDHDAGLPPGRQGGPHRAVKSVYKATQIFSGPVRFMLAGSGHIAGVVNPPRGNKYQHWINETGKNRRRSRSGSRARPSTRARGGTTGTVARAPVGAKVPARQPGDGELTAIEDAPGSYVKVRTID